jgi:hypothetical protein
MASRSTYFNKLDRLETADRTIDAAYRWFEGDRESKTNIVMRKR